MDINSFKSVDVDLSRKYYYKIIGNFTLNVYVGAWGHDLYSCPECTNLSIYDYATVIVAIADKYQTACFSKDVTELKLDSIGLTNSYYSDVAMFTGVSITQLEIIYSRLNNLVFKNKIVESISSQNIDKIGGKCSVCGGHDKWASWSNGKCFCYMHTPGY